MATVRRVVSSDGPATAWYEYDDVAMEMTAVGVSGLSGRTFRLTYIDRSGTPREFVTTTDRSVAIQSARRPALTTLPGRGILLGADIRYRWE